jgi:hypothetical protein
VADDGQGSSCGAVVTAEERTAHEAACLHTLVGCPHQGCDTMVPRRLLETHAAGCEHREVQCDKCQQVRVRGAGLFSDC